MSVIVVASEQPGAGKSTAAAAVGLHSYHQGLRTGLLRVAGDSGAEADAAFFADLPFAAPPSGHAVDGGAVLERAARYDVGLLVVETGSVDQACEIAKHTGAGLVLVARGAEAGEALAAAAASVGELLRGVAAVAVPSHGMEATRVRLTAAALPVLFVLAEDRTLHAPSIADVARATGAQVLLGEAREDTIAENILIAPVSADPAYLHFRRYPHKLVVARSDKTELQISAVTTSTNAMLLTGGITPGVYTFDRLANEGVPLLLANGETVEVIAQIEGLYDEARFHSPRKLERLEELLRDTFDPSPLGLPAAVSA